MGFIKSAWFVAILGVAAITVAASEQTKKPVKDSPAAPSTEPSEESIQASRFAIDYDLFHREAFKSDAAARRFIMLAHCGIFDAAGAEMYAYHLEELLKHYGDQHFSKILASMDDDVEKDALGQIAFNAGFGESDKEWNRFRKQYPKVLKIMKRVDVAE